MAHPVCIYICYKIVREVNKTDKKGTNGNFMLNYSLELEYGPY